MADGRQDLRALYITVYVVVWINYWLPVHSGRMLLLPCTRVGTDCILLGPAGTAFRRRVQPRARSGSRSRLLVELVNVDYINGCFSSWSSELLIIKLELRAIHGQSGHHASDGMECSLLEYWQEKNSTHLRKPNMSFIPSPSQVG